MVVDVVVDVHVDAVVDALVVVNGDGDGDGDGGETPQPLPRPADTGGMLSFQKLDVYKAAIEFLALSSELPVQIPRGHAQLADQLRRAALSIPLNIAEAAGRISEPDAARRYAVARGSAMECAAILDGLIVLRVIEEEMYRRCADVLARIVAMLTRLCR